MYFASESGWTVAEAERAFRRVAGARDRATLWRRLRRSGMTGARLTVHDGTAPRDSVRGEVREIPLDAIVATLEPNRAAHFDSEFRPHRATRERWVRVWVAEHRGPGLPPISVTPLGDAYAVRDGHHRVSVARARGLATIHAVIV
jgi:hypothetical protein